MSDIHAVRLKMGSCPFCGAKIDAATKENIGSGPKEGDIGLCVYCGEWLVYAKDLTVRKPTDIEYQRIGRDRRLMAVRDVWLRMKHEKPTRT